MTKQQIKEEINQVLVEIQDDPELFSFFHFGDLLVLTRIPDYVKYAKLLGTLVHMQPEDGGYEDSWHRTGYNSSYKDKTKIPYEIIPQVKSSICNSNEYYPANCGFNAYALYIRDFTHDYNMYVNNLKMYYDDYNEDPGYITSEFILNYLRYVQPYIVSMADAINNLVNGADYDNDNMFVCHYDKKQQLYKVYYFKYQELHFGDNQVAYTYDFPVFRKNQIHKAFKSKVVHYFVQENIK